MFALFIEKNQSKQINQYFAIMLHHCILIKIAGTNYRWGEINMAVGWGHVEARF